MIAIYEAFLEIPDKGVLPFELIRLARDKKLITVIPNKPTNLKDNEYLVKRKDNNKVKGINPLTGRQKGKIKTTYLKTIVKPEERTLKNLPRLANKKPRVKFQDWLMLAKSSKSKHSVGQAPDGTWYGWSHRAIGSFNVGKEIKSGIIGNKYEYGKEVDKKYNDMSDKHGYKVADKWRKETIGKFKPYKIASDEEAFQHAERFAADVS